jgi:hypothetical protein
MYIGLGTVLTIALIVLLILAGAIAAVTSRDAVALPPVASGGSAV